MEALIILNISINKKDENVGSEVVAYVLKKRSERSLS